MTTIIHEIDSKQLKQVMREGLNRTAQGSKSRDKLIRKTDELLDMHIPTNLSHLGVSRQNNSYGYLVFDNGLIDIKDGVKKSVKDFLAQSKMSVLQLSVNPRACYASDLDAYDSVKLALASDKLSHAELTKLAKAYWQKTVRLDKYTSGIQRPEVMITYDIPPKAISVLK
jgi:hypothetical protein